MPPTGKFGRILLTIVVIALIALALTLAFPRLVHFSSFWVQPLPSTRGMVWVNFNSGFFSFAILFAGLMAAYLLFRGVFVRIRHRKAR